MLADGSHDVHSGRLDRDTHLSLASKRAILDFITQELPRWRDDPQRPTELAETRLTEHLCDYLNSATYFSNDWSHIQIRTETADEAQAGRKMDLAIKPRGTELIIEGRRHTIYQTILPIECKRLPTPKDNSRDEREYVFTEHASTGGIQRFKAGNHGAKHTLAAMIGYIQRDTCAIWHARITDWINGLITSKQKTWSARDFLRLERNDATLKVAELISSHPRVNALPEIELRHLWVEMT